MSADPPEASASKADLDATSEERMFEARLEEIAVARRWVADFARRAGFDARSVHELQVALSEALSNVVLHAYAEQKGQVRVRVLFEGGCLGITIQDWGEPFAVEGWNPPDLSEPRAGGYGVMLMRRYADELVYTRADGESNLMELRRHLRPRDPEREA